MKYLEGITPRKYQESIFSSCVDKNCLVVLPTGLGKTLIAIMLAINRIEKFPEQKILLLAPTKPLVEQHFFSFKKYLPELFADIQMFTGAIKKEKRKEIWETADIIFSTPQCIANDLKKRLYNLEKVSLLVEDEAHRCVKNYDYNYIGQKYIKQSKNPRILALTASPGSNTKKIKEICKNLSIEEVELRTRDSPDVKEYLQKLEFEKIEVKFPSELEEIRHVMLKLFDRYVNELRERKVLFGSASKVGLINLQKEIMGTIARGNKNFNYLLGASACAQAIKIQHALELLETQTIDGFNKYLKKLLDEAGKRKSRGVVKLVAQPEFRFAFTKSSQLLEQNYEHPKLIELIQIIKKEQIKNEDAKIIVFTQFRDSANAIKKRLNNIPGIKAKVFVGQAKKNGSGLSQKEQKQIIDDFKDNKINVLCATCIAEEGLDIPEVNAVVFYEPISSAIRSIQRAGRTARLSKGKLIILITKGTRDETFYYISRSREKKMSNAIEDIKKKISDGTLHEKDPQKKLF